MPTTIYIVRHGESESNAAFAGNKRIVAHNAWGTNLTEKGRKQAQALSQKLKSVQFDVVFSSDLARAEQTAEILCAGRNLRIITSPDIRESNAHAFHHFDLEKQEEVIRYITSLSEQEKLTFRAEDGMETYMEAANRLQQFIVKILAEHQGKTILIVAHGTLMRSFLIQLGHAMYNQLPSGSIDNTGYAIIENDSDKFVITETWGVNRKDNQC